MNRSRWKHHRGVGERGICWACVAKHLRALGVALVPVALGATGVFEYEHHHAPAPAPAVVVALSPWQNWPCDLSPREAARQAPDLFPEVCQSGGKRK